MYDLYGQNRVCNLIFISIKFTSMISSRDQEIWSCDICYQMFHLKCIRDWADREESGEDKNWRCPGCQYSYSKIPKYTCFCHKRNNPPFLPGEIPHSCGEICNKRLNIKSNDCNHCCTE